MTMLRGSTDEAKETAETGSRAEPGEDVHDILQGMQDLREDGPCQTHSGGVAMRHTLRATPAKAMRLEV